MWNTQDGWEMVGEPMVFIDVPVDEQGEKKIYGFER